MIPGFLFVLSDMHNENSSVWSAQKNYNQTNTCVHIYIYICMYNYIYIDICVFPHSLAKYGAIPTKLNCWFTAGIETPDLPDWRCRAVGFVFGSFKIHALSLVCTESLRCSVALVGAILQAEDPATVMWHTFQFRENLATNFWYLQQVLLESFS